MKILINIKKIPLEIGQLLSQNKKLCGLIIDDSADPQLVEKTYNELLNDKYFTIYSPVSDGISDKERNTYLTIVIDTINLKKEDNNIFTTGNIYITTDENHILIKNNKNRLLEMADQIVQTIDNAKLSSAGTVSVDSLVYTTLTKHKIGYIISFSVSDQQIESVEI